MSLIRCKPFESNGFLTTPAHSIVHLKSQFGLEYRLIKQVKSMIRPASEIEYPPSEALCTKARMIARMEKLAGNTENLVNVLSRRFENMDDVYQADIAGFSKEQKRLLENMKRIIRR